MRDACLHMDRNIHMLQRERHLFYTDGSLVESISKTQLCTTDVSEIIRTIRKIMRHNVN